MSRVIAPIEERASYGIGVLLVAQLFFLLLDPSAKWLGATGMPVTEIIFVRYFVHVALLVLFFLPAQGPAIFVTSDWRLELLRGLFLLGTTVFNFFALQFLPLTITTALMFTMPLIICALSVPLLGERVGWRRWIAILVGFGGILIITRPGSESFHPAAILSLLGAVCAALYSIFTRKLAGIDSAATQQLYAGLIALICIAPFAFNGWVWPQDAAGWFAFIAIGASGVLAHQLMTVAHRFAPPSTLAPFNYLQILYMAVVSWLVFNQPPDVWFFAGAPVIIGSGLYVWLRERRLARPTVPVTIED
jgi:drug/metabolite transporter (DMT)-like permease